MAQLDPATKPAQQTAALRDLITAPQAALGDTSTGAADHSRYPDEVEMVRKATEVLGTNYVVRWMRSQIPSLGNQTPYELLQTEDGRRQVGRVLLKIEHGVY